MTSVSLPSFAFLLFCLLFAFGVVLGFVEFWMQNECCGVQTLGLLCFLGEDDCLLEEMTGSVC